MIAHEMDPVYPSCGAMVIVEEPALGGTMVGLVEVSRKLSFPNAKVEVEAANVESPE